ncbi:MAG: TRAP transporter substrate-binding protein [Gammaproteobacteria bacterium]
MAFIGKKIATIVLALGGLLGAQVSAQEVTLRLHHFLPAKAYIPSQVIEPLARKIETESGGRIKIQIYPSMQMGGTPAQLYDQARDGVVDISWCVVSYMPGRFTKTEVVDLPFLASKSAEVNSKALWDYISTVAADEFKETKVLAIHSQGAGLLHTRTAVTSIESARGMKIRGGIRNLNRLLEKAGISPVPVPLPGTGEALSKGVIQGTTAPWDVVNTLRISEMARHHTEFAGDTGMYNTSVVFSMNRKKFDSLPDDLRKVIDRNSGLGLSAEFGRAMDTSDREAREITQKMGNSIVVLNAEETRRWQALGAEVQNEWISGVSSKGLDGNQLISGFKALIAKHSK